MIRTKIQSCTGCPLYKNMCISPVATEIFGENIKVLFIFSDTVKKENDDSQEVLSGPYRSIIDKLCKDIKVNYAFTFFTKCSSDKAYNKKQTLECAKWIDFEIKLIKPQLVIGFGKRIEKYKDILNKNILYLESIKPILDSSKKTDKLKNIIIEKIK